MITILSRRVISKIWVATLKVKVTACSTHYFVIWSRILEVFDRKGYKWQNTVAYDNKRTFWETGRGLLYCPQYYQMLVYSNINSIFGSLDILQAVVPKRCVQPGCTSLTWPSHNVWHVNQETTAQERVSAFHQPYVWGHWHSYLLAFKKNC